MWIIISRFYITTRVFISITFISNTMLKLAKNEAKTKQHPEAELLLFENHSLSSSSLSSKKIGHILKYVQKASVPVSMRL